MSEIFVTGHRNPDTDAIVAAISYAALRNALGDREYKAARIGSINDETARMLDRFGFEPPIHIHNMRTQVCDLDFDRPPALSGSVPMDLAWRTLRDGDLSSLPIVNEDGTLLGMLSAGDIATFELQTVNENHIVDLPLFNLLSVIEGTLVNEYSTEVSSISGELFITLPQNYEDQALTNPDSILICGNQPEVIENALRSGVRCLIICRADIQPEWAEKAERTVVISTPLSARRVSRIIYQANPVERVCQTSTIDQPSTCRTTWTMCRRSRSKAATARTRSSMRTTASSVRSRATICCARAQARRAGRPQRGRPVRPRAGPGRDHGDHRPPPSGRYPDPPADPRAQRAGRQHEHDHHRHVPGVRRCPLSEDRGADGRGDFVGHRFVQVPHLHEEGYRHGRASRAHREYLARGARARAVLLRGRGGKARSRSCS